MLLEYVAQSNNLVKENNKSKNWYKQQIAKEKIEDKETVLLRGQFERHTKY